MNNKNRIDFSKISIDESLKLLRTSKKGLSGNEAEKRITEYGYNEIPEKKINPVIRFLTYFWGPIPWMIEAAAIISAIIKHWTDFGIIMVLLLLNGIVAFWQENKAQNVNFTAEKEAGNKRKGERDGRAGKMEPQKSHAYFHTAWLCRGYQLVHPVLYR